VTTWLNASFEMRSRRVRGLTTRFAASGGLEHPHVVAAGIGTAANGSRK
jgi:hypothetical protein